MNPVRAMLSDPGATFLAAVGIGFALELGRVLAAAWTRSAVALYDRLARPYRRRRWQRWLAAPSTPPTAGSA